MLPVQNEAALVGRSNCASSQQCRRWKKIFIGRTDRCLSSQSKDNPLLVWTESAYSAGCRLVGSKSGAFVSLIAKGGCIQFYETLGVQSFLQLDDSSYCEG